MRKWIGCVLTVLLFFSVSPVNAAGEPAQDNRSDLYMVSLPSDFAIIVDPYELAGRGQVYSEPLTVKNEGGGAVYVVLSDVRCSYVAENVTVKDTPVPSDSPEKEIQLLLRHRETGQLRSFSGEGDALSFILPPGGKTEFEITGTASLAPEEPWLSGDVRVSMSFEMVEDPPGVCKWEEALLPIPSLDPEQSQLEQSQLEQSQPEQSQPASPEEEESEPVKPDSTSPEGEASEPAKPDSTSPEGEAPEPAKPDSASPEGEASEPAKPDSASPEGEASEPEKPEPAKPDSASPEGEAPEPGVIPVE